MSDASDNPIRYEILPGLPPYGPPALTFSSTGRGKHQEGFVVRFFTASGEEWVGNFISGLDGISGVFPHPNGHHLIVFSAGQGYVVDPETRQCVHTFSGQALDVIPIPQLEAFVVGNGLWFEAIDRNGLWWRSRRISWDGMRNIKVADVSLSGEAYDPLSGTEEWRPFTLDLTTGEAKGGSYCGPPM
jgi:hypothetical protein